MCWLGLRRAILPHSALAVNSRGDLFGLNRGNQFGDRQIQAGIGSGFSSRAAVGDLGVAAAIFGRHDIGDDARARIDARRRACL